MRALSDREREAMAAFEALGAPLSPAFTADELRRAFRTLARAYHPDRHGDRGAHEQARFGELFTRARAAYETLIGLFARVH
jgi:curved DNA-binding protein CbpA